MAKKKTGLSETLFGGIDPYGGEAESLQAATSLLPLARLRPDPGQPRRLLPGDLASAVSSGDLSPAAALQAWLERDEGSAALRELRRLADSIARHGLINPVTVRLPRVGEPVPPGVDYFLVTGERRYWAHLLLQLEGRDIALGEGQQSPQEIRAAVSAEGITVRAHQLIENIMREDINAVEKARGLWALRYELSGLSDAGVNYSSLAAGEVNYSSPDLVPWNQVSDELGISKRYRIFLTSVLSNLTPEAQELVQEHHLAEITIRPIVQKLRDEPQLQLEALRQVVAWQEENEEGEGERRAITRSVKDLVELLLVQQQRAAAATAVERAADALDQEATTRRFRSRLRSTLRFLQRLPQDEVTLLARDLALDQNYKAVADELQDLQRQLATLLQEVDHYRDRGGD